MKLIALFLQDGTWWKMFQILTKPLNRKENYVLVPHNQCMHHLISFNNSRINRRTSEDNWKINIKIVAMTDLNKLLALDKALISSPSKHPIFQFSLKRDKRVWSRTMSKIMLSARRIKRDIKEDQTNSLNIKGLKIFKKSR